MHQRISASVPLARCKISAALTWEVTSPTSCADLPAPIMTTRLPCKQGRQKDDAPGRVAKTAGGARWPGPEPAAKHGLQCRSFYMIRSGCLILPLHRSQSGSPWPEAAGRL